MFKKLILAAAIFLFAASAHAITPDEVRASGTVYQGKIADVLMPQGWQKGTFDSTTWLDLVAPRGSRMPPTIRFEKKSLFSKSEQDFMSKFEALAKKAGAARIQKARVDGILFHFYIVPSRRRAPRGRPENYDMVMAADWPRKTGSFRDAMFITITERTLLDRWRPEQAAELLHKRLLPDAAVMAVLDSVSFKDVPLGIQTFQPGMTGGTPSGMPMPGAGAAGSLGAVDPAIESALRTGRIAGIWKPYALIIAGQQVTGEAMEQAAAGRLRTFVFNADGTFFYEPQNLTWSPRAGQNGAYTFGDLSGKIWYEKGQLHFQDGDGYHFVYDKLPNPNPSEPELLAGAIGEWKPVELIADDTYTMGEDLNRAAVRYGTTPANIFVRPNGAVEGSRRRISRWALENGQIVFDDRSLRFYAGRLEEITPKGARLIYAPAERAESHRSVFEAELDERERPAAEADPLIGLWIPYAALSTSGAETTGDAFARTYKNSAHAIRVMSDGTLRYGGKTQGVWRFEGGVCVFEMTSGIYRGNKIIFENGELRVALASTLWLKYAKKR